MVEATHTLEQTVSGGSTQCQKREPAGDEKAVANEELRATRRRIAEKHGLGGMAGDNEQALDTRADLTRKHEEAVGATATRSGDPPYGLTLCLCHVGVG